MPPPLQKLIIRDLLLENGINEKVLINRLDGL